MDRKQMCVANVQYKKPTANEAKRAKGLLRYLTYRESRDEAARYAAGRERWEDHGMGGSVAEIAQRCEALQSKHVLLFSLVYNVNPDLMAMVAPEQREQFVRELTVQTTEAFFEQRGIDTGVEWSYVHAPPPDRRSAVTGTARSAHACRAAGDVLRRWVRRARAAVFQPEQVGRSHRHAARPDRAAGR